MCVCEGAQKRATGTRMRADWSGFEGVSGQIMCGGGSVHKESGGNSNAVMLQVWAWAGVQGVVIYYTISPNLSHDDLHLLCITSY